MRFAELEGHEILRIGAGVDQLLDPFENLDHARIREGQLAGEEFLIIVRPELAQQRLDRDIGAGVGTVADTLRDGRHARRACLLDEIEELRLGQLRIRGQRDAERLQHVLVVVELDGVGLLRNAIRLAVVGPDLACPRFDLVPIHRVVERHDVVCRDVFGLVGLEIKDVGAFARRQRGLERRE